MNTEDLRNDWRLNGQEEFLMNASVLSRLKIKHPLALFSGRFVVVLDLRQQAFVLRLASEKNCCASYFIFERDSTLGCSRRIM